MNETRYFVIYGTDDGANIKCMTKEQLLNSGMLSDGQKFLDKVIFNEINFMNEVLIIKGQIVIPRTKTVVKEFDID